MTTSAVRRLLVAFLLVAAPGVALGSAPAASAATCTSAGGVSVVVDYRELGGGTVTACAPDGGGRSAAAIFASVGVGITYATRQPGFVCRVNGVPTSDPCVNASPANAYWGLWWSDGSKASWTYSSYGVGSLTVPAGGSVGWSWQQDRAAGSSVPPSVAPPVMKTTTPTSTPSPSPTSSPSQTSSPTSSPSPGAGSAGGSAGGSGAGTGGGSQPNSPSSSPTKAPGGSGGSGSSPSSSPSSSASSSAPTTSSSPSESPLASESPGDSTRSAAPGKAGDDKVKKDDEQSADRSERGESPSDSPTSAGGDPSASAAESPGDSAPSASTEAADPQGDGPARVPAALTWGVLGLLGIAIAGSAVVARRRRGV